VAKRPDRPVPILPESDPFRSPGDYYNYLSGIREDNLLDGLIGNNGPLSATGGGWSNGVTGLGTFGRDKVMQGRFHEPFRIDDPQLSGMYNGNDLAQRIVCTKPREMFRRGWILVIPEPDEPEGDDTSETNQDEPQEMGADERPLGGESGPAAPGSPLVDPMGAPPDNATSNANVGPSNVKNGNDPQLTGENAAKPASKTPEPSDNQKSKTADKDSKTTEVAPAATGAYTSNPMQVNKPVPGGAAKPTTPTDPVVGDPMGEKNAKGAITPGSNYKGAPPPTPGLDQGPSTGSPHPAAKPGAPSPEQGSQNDTAKMALDIEAYAARLGLIPRTLEASIFGRLYGGGLLIVGADDGTDMSEPLNEQAIKTIRYLSWIDRRFIFASTWYADIGPKYGEVETWQIVNPFGGQSNTRVHESRVIRFDGQPVDFLMRRRLLGWSLSVLQAPYDVLRQFDTSFQSISNLMADLSQAVMKINGLAQMISNDPKTLQTRMAMVDISRSSARMVFLDAENEEFSREPTPLTGVADVIEMQMLRVAAACEMPVAILFGREPSGLNATGDADFRRFYDTIAGAQKYELEPKLRRLYTLICLAQDAPTKGVCPERGVQFTWHKLYEPSEKEQAEIRWLMAQADDKYITNKTLMPEEVACSRFRSGDLHLDTEIELELRDEALDKMELPPSGAELAKQDQENKQAEMQLNAAGIAAKGPPGTKPPPFGKPPGPPGAKPPAPGAKPPAGPPPAATKRPTADAWSEARYDSPASDVYDQMLEDFPEEAIQWVEAAPWRGPSRVKLSNIDFSNAANWEASKPGADRDKVEKFMQMLKDGQALKPVVLVQRPKGKAMIVDGHHRALATKEVGGRVIQVYIAKVPTQDGPWDQTHDMQTGDRSG
jgi:phage-related protein (TIGR01555 family)